MEALRSKAQSAEDSVSYTVVTVVAKFKDTEPRTLQPPLHEAIDPEALDTLFTDGTETDRNGKISFAYSGCHVSIGSDGRVLVQDVEDSPEVSAEQSQL